MHTWLMAGTFLILGIVGFGTRLTSIYNQAASDWRVTKTDFGVRIISLIAVLLVLVVLWLTTSHI